MKRYISLILVLLFILSIVGCDGQYDGEQNTSQTSSETSEKETETLDLTLFEPVDASQETVLVRSNATLSKGLFNSVWIYMWDSPGWLCGDSDYFGERFDEEKIAKIPEIEYNYDFKIYYSENVTSSSVSICDMDFNNIKFDGDGIDFESLEEGYYYLIIFVRVQGDYIEEGEDYEESGIEYIYKIKV